MWAVVVFIRAFDWAGPSQWLLPAAGRDGAWQPAEPGSRQLSRAVGGTDMHPDCPCGLCFSQHCSWVPKVPRGCQAPHRLGLERLGLPREAPCLFLPISVVLKMRLPASHSLRLSLPSWLCYMYSCPFCHDTVSPFIKYKPKQTLQSSRCWLSGLSIQKITKGQVWRCESLTEVLRRQRQVDLPSL